MTGKEEAWGWPGVEGEDDLGTWVANRVEMGPQKEGTVGLGPVRFKGPVGKTMLHVGRPKYGAPWAPKFFGVSSGLVCNFPLSRRPLVTTSERCTST